jgi:hypothetical protein
MAIFRARHVDQIVVGTTVWTGAQWTGSIILSQYFTSNNATTTNIASYGKNLEVTGAEGSFSNVVLFGQDSQGVQNQEVEETARSMREVTLTLVFKGATPSGYGGYTGTVAYISGAGTSATSQTWTQARGDSTTTEKAVMMIVRNTSLGQLNICFNNVYFKTIGSLRIAADGHLEQEISFTCKAGDYKDEYLAY